MERTPINDATVPILADGIKWLGYAPKAHLLWNLGVLRRLAVGRTDASPPTTTRWSAAWPGCHVLSDQGRGTLLHLGVSGRYGKAKDGKLQLRSRPESCPAPYFVDTGKFAADRLDVLRASRPTTGPGRCSSAPSTSSDDVDAPAERQSALPRRRGRRDLAGRPARPGRTTQRAATSMRIHRRARSSTADPAPGRSSRASRTSISTPARRPGASSGDSRRW